VAYALSAENTEIQTRSPRAGYWLVTRFDEKFVSSFSFEHLW